jgi:hypothetical protein
MYQDIAVANDTEESGGLLLDFNISVIFLYGAVPGTGGL